MSYDLFLWSTKHPKITISEFEFGDSALTIDTPSRVEPEDIPEHIAAMLTTGETYKYVTGFHLQPYTVDKELCEKVLKIAGGYAEQYDGTVDNPQAETIALPKRRFGRITKDREIVRTVFYSHADKNLKDYLPSLVDLFERYFPPALPRRYGAYEPPQFKYEECGKEHFINSLSDEIFPVWYGTNPVSNVFLKDPNRTDTGSYVGYRCNCVIIDILKDAYAEEEYRKALHILFEKVSVELNVFFAQIIDESDLENISWFWCGIPRNLGYRAIIGEPYFSLIKPKGKMIAEKTVLLSKKTRIPRKFVLSPKLFWRPNVISADKVDLAKFFPFK